MNADAPTLPARLGHLLCLDDFEAVRVLGEVVPRRYNLISCDLHERVHRQLQGKQP